MNQPLEKKYIIALSKGDSHAFETVFMHFFPKVKFFICGLLKNETEAEDLSQDVFVKIWTKRESLGNISNFNAYVYRMARNVVYDYLDKEFLHEYIQAEQAVNISDNEADITEILYAEELEALVQIAVRQMPPQRKTIYEMSRKEGLTNEEISQRLSISKRTVEAHLLAALADIRKTVHFITLLFF